MTDPDAIQRDIRSTRDELRQTLETLENRFSAEHIVGHAADLLEREGGRAAEAAVSTARKNPLAVGLIGAGVALLAARSMQKEGAEDADDRGPTHADYDPRIKPTAPGLSQPEPPMAGFDERMEAAERAASRTQKKGDADMAYTHDVPETRSQSLRSRAKHSARAMRERLHDGLDRLPHEARERVLAARLRAIEAQHSVEAQMQRTAESARHNAREHPLLLGIAALGIGAALGAALPRTSVENQAIGAQRDRMLDEADRIFRDEVAKARHVAEAAVEEGKSAVKDTLRHGPPTEDDPARRVSKAAQSEAERQKLGSVG
jgi:ElaB/YqjD/DUF883 family membrane-anchored ribosome-binding protein